MTTHAKIGCTSSRTFLVIYVFFSIPQSSQYVGNDVKPMLQEVKVGHSIRWQGEGSLDYRQVQ
jgi:hypothetical protein